MTQKSGATSGENDEELNDDQELNDGDDLSGKDKDPDNEGQPKTGEVDWKKKYHKDMTNMNKVVGNLAKEVTALKNGKSSEDEDLSDVDLNNWDPSNVKMVKKVASDIVKSRANAQADTPYELNTDDEKELDTFMDKNDLYDHHDDLVKRKKKFPELSFKKLYKNFIAEDEDGTPPPKKIAAGSPKGGVEKQVDKINGGQSGGKPGGSAKKFSNEELVASMNKTMGLGG